VCQSAELSLDDLDAFCFRDDFEACDGFDVFVFSAAALSDVALFA
jgi:hypothetical protein